VPPCPHGDFRPGQTASSCGPWYYRYQNGHGLTNKYDPKKNKHWRFAHRIAPLAASETRLRPVQSTVTKSLKQLLNSLAHLTWLTWLTCFPAGLGKMFEIDLTTTINYLCKQAIEQLSLYILSISLCPNELSSMAPRIPSPAERLNHMRRPSNSVYTPS
jgi:hypothetical protein